MVGLRHPHTALWSLHRAKQNIHISKAEEEWSVVVSALCERENIRVAMVVKKHEIEAALFVEKQQINSGHLKEDNPLDTSEAFRIFCEACRR